MHPTLHPWARAPDVGAALGLGDQAGIEGEHAAMAEMALLVAIARAVARASRSTTRIARPVGWSLAELVVGSDLQEGHRHPLVEEGRQGVLPVTTRLGSAARRRPFSTTSYSPRTWSKSSWARSSTTLFAAAYGSPVPAHSAHGSNRGRGTECPNGRSASSGWDSSAGGQGRHVRVEMYLDFGVERPIWTLSLSLSPGWLPVHLAWPSWPTSQFTFYGRRSCRRCAWGWPFPRS